MEPVKLFQYNTLKPLMAGLYRGSFTIGELLEHGDLGVGTLDSIDGGRLIVLDGGKTHIRQRDQGIILNSQRFSHGCQRFIIRLVVPHQAEVIFRQRFEMTDEEGGSPYWELLL